MAEKKSKPDYKDVFFGTPRRALISGIGIGVLILMLPVMVLSVIVAAKSLAYAAISLGVPLLFLVGLFRLLLRKLCCTLCRPRAGGGAAWRPQVYSVPMS